MKPYLKGKQQFAGHNPKKKMEGLDSSLWTVPYLFQYDFSFKKLY
jgi:hypothetical protein